MSVSDDRAEPVPDEAEDVGVATAVISETKDPQHDDDPVGYVSATTAMCPCHLPPFGRWSGIGGFGTLECNERCRDQRRDSSPRLLLHRPARIPAYPPHREPLAASGVGLLSA
jgi:hypothetical protein